MKKPAKRVSRDLAASRPQVAVPEPGERLLADVRGLIEATRQQVAQAVNAGLVTLYWHVGKRLRQEILGQQRAAYSEQIVNALSAQLTAEYGRGFARRNLFYMIQFAEAFPDERIVATLSRQLARQDRSDRVERIDRCARPGLLAQNDGRSRTRPEQYSASFFARVLRFALPPSE